ncbi:replicative DNA helicase [Youhaiella tibetensis]|uniref:Replicative DNA helicase n=1 Tax=Paradevosia tibetensis TaxID=1447062 RepID=A0A5B9DN10_9HYPH|nr:replicative DNA helicase [Youhaiella tibetensis]AKR55141.1 Replicative DNA helicase [Devosia sp. H5989]QEE20234.1 replicative DNA helicase [Youhaiella tibetensis]GGF25901.1 replicative DNA helicase [Youhaiella tibetensis]
MAEQQLRLVRPEDEKAYRLAPHNVEAEQALLGAILVNNEAFYRVSDFLEPDHFYEPIHRQIYEVCGKIIRAGKIATPLTVKTFLPDTLLPEVTMPQYLAKLAAEATTVINASDYGQSVYDLALRRNLIVIGEEMTATAYEADVEMTPEKQIEEAERALYDLAEKGRYDGGFQPFNAALKDAISMAGEAYGRDGSLSGLATGLTDLDRLMGGLQRSDLIILAARPAMGKTSLATNIAFNVAKSWKTAVQADGHMKTVDGGVVGFFSLEMSSEQLATRILAEQAEISSSDIRRGNIHESQFSKLVDTSNLMAQVPLFIDDTGGISIGQLAARARRLKRQKGLDLLIVDYLQLLSGSKKSSDNRVQELTEITTGLKALAKELEAPIIALSQLSRQVEAREDKHPQLADLRESGSIEQDADVVLFVYREEYYLKNKEPKEGTPEHLQWQAEMEQVHGRAEVIIGKQRHGPTGTVQLQFEANLTRFGNLARSDYLPERME